MRSAPPSRFRPTPGLLLLAALALLSAACSRHREQAQPGGATPQAAVADGYALLRRNDIDGLYRHALPPADYAAMRARWGLRTNASEFTPAERAQFARVMAMLTAPGAQQLLWLQLKPRLQRVRARERAQIPIMVGMLRTMAETGVRQSTRLAPDEKVQALKALAALGGWAARTDWLDPARVEKVLGVLVGTAQAMPFRTLDQALALPYVPAMQALGRLWSGFKQALAVYGLSIDVILDTARIEVLSDDGNVAVVRTTFDVLGTPIVRENTLIRQDGRWYDRATLLHWRQVLARPAAPATAGSAAAPAVSRSVAPAPVPPAHAPAAAASR